MKTTRRLKKMDKQPTSREALASFTMQALVRQTGIAPDTLRAWERRYGFPEPARSGGGHRLYSMREVEAIRWVMEKQKEGLRARQAIELWQHQSAQLGAATTVMPSLEGDTTSALKSAWVQSCLALDDHTATQIFNSANAMLGPEVALLQVTTAGLSEIGERWAASTASVAQEHFASAVAMRHAQSLLNMEAPATRTEKLLVTCPEGETHVYPSVVLSYLLQRRGWRVMFMNANLPQRDLTNTVAHEQPALVISCVQTVPATGALLADAEVLRAANVAFAFGGSVFVRYPSLSARIPGVYLGNRLAEASDMVQRILQGDVPPNTPAPLGKAWRSASDALPDILRRVESDVLNQIDAWSVRRADAEAELELLRAYLLSMVQLSAAEMLPNVWVWSERMLTARGLNEPTRAKFLHAYRAALRAHWAKAEQFGMNF